MQLLAAKLRIFFDICKVLGENRSENMFFERDRVLRILFIGEVAIDVAKLIYLRSSLFLSLSFRYDALR